MQLDLSTILAQLVQQRMGTEKLIHGEAFVGNTIITIFRFRVIRWSVIVFQPEIALGSDFRNNDNLEGSPFVFQRCMNWYIQFSVDNFLKKRGFQFIAFHFRSRYPILGVCHSVGHIVQPFAPCSNDCTKCSTVNPSGPAHSHPLSARRGTATLTKPPRFSRSAASGPLLPSLPSRRPPQPPGAADCRRQTPVWAPLLP